MPEPLEVIKSGNYDEIKKIFEENKPSFEITFEEAQKQWDVEDHPVNDVNLRKKKEIEKPLLDSSGNPRVNADGHVIKQKESIEVTRVTMPFQKIIVNRRVGFLLGNEIGKNVIFNKEDSKEQALVDFVDRIQDDNKMDYLNKEIARRMMSEMACAELWYLVEDVGDAWQYIAQALKITKPKFELKIKILSPVLGDLLYPLKDSYGDLIAFGRSYKIKEENKEIEHFDVFTTEFTYKYVNRGVWALDTTATGGGKVQNTIKKIPIIYHSQDKPEWFDVQRMIERIETVVSNHGDMNDYFGAPILAIFGELVGAVSKSDGGKILQLASEAKASFLALDSPPESIKMEVENLEKFIYAMSQTPNIAFAEMKQLGDLSGVSLKLMFLDAHLAARAKEETFGIGIQRRLNLIKAFIGNVLDVSLSEAAKSVRIKPVFTPYLPANTKEDVEVLTMAVTGGIMSKETAIEKNPLVSDAEVEMERVQNERAIEMNEDIESQPAVKKLKIS